LHFSRLLVIVCRVAVAHMRLELLGVKAVRSSYKAIEFKL